jgi:hypothetical protein
LLLLLMTSSPLSPIVTYVASAAATREIRTTYFCNHCAPARGRWICALRTIRCRLGRVDQAPLLSAHLATPHLAGTFVISMSVDYLTLIDVDHVGRSDDKSLLLFFSKG